MDRTIQVWNREIVTANADSTLKLWEPSTAAEILTLAKDGGGVTSVAFRPDGYKMVSANWDRTIKIWHGTPLPE